MNLFTCPHCGQKEKNVQFLCTMCWFKLPAKERVQISGMIRRKQNMDSKLEKSLRYLSKLEPHAASLRSVSPPDHLDTDTPAGSS